MQTLLDTHKHNGQYAHEKVIALLNIREIKIKTTISLHSK